MGHFPTGACKSCDKKDAKVKKSGALASGQKVGTRLVAIGT